MRVPTTAEIMAVKKALAVLPEGNEETHRAVAERLAPCWSNWCDAEQYTRTQGMVDGFILGFMCRDMGGA